MIPSIFFACFRLATNAIHACMQAIVEALATSCGRCLEDETTTQSAIARNGDCVARYINDIDPRGQVLRSERTEALF
jgi:Flp pilus assembly protein TadG